MKITFDNYFQCSTGNFTKCEQAPDKEPDFISPDKSKYWHDYENETIYRESNHWGSAINCNWRLDNHSVKRNNNERFVGKIHLSKLKFNFGQVTQLKKMLGMLPIEARNEIFNSFENED